MTNRANRGWRIRGNIARAIIHRSRPTPDQPRNTDLNCPSPRRSQDTRAEVNLALIIPSY